MSQPDIHLYTAATMNGYKPVMFLEEAGVPYDLTFIDFAKNEQKAPDFVKDINPNGKIPAIWDRAEGRHLFPAFRLQNNQGKTAAQPPDTQGH